MKRFAVILTVVLAAALLLFGTAAYADIAVSNGMDASAKLATGSSVTFDVNCGGLAAGSYQNYLVELTYDDEVLGEPVLESSSCPSGWTLFNGQAGNGKVTFFASDETLKNPSGKGLSLKVTFKVTGISKKDKTFTTSVAVSGAYLSGGKYVSSMTSDSVDMVLLGGVPVGTVLTEGKNEYIVIGAKEAALYRADKNAANVTVPDTIKRGGISFKVTEISAKAFYKNTKLRTVAFGKNVKKIGDQAFEGCTGLSSVTLPANIASVGRKAFYNCKGLKTLNIKTSKLTDISAVGAKAFNGTPARMKVNIFVSRGKVYNAIRSTLIKRGVSGKAVFKKK